MRGSGDDYRELGMKTKKKASSSGSGYVSLSSRTTAVLEQDCTTPPHVW